MTNEKYTIIEVVNESGKSSLYLMDNDGYYSLLGQHLDRGGVATARIAVQRTMRTFGLQMLHDIAVRIITYKPHGQFAKAITYAVPSEGAASLV